MTSERVGDADAVLHAFFLPEWAVKEDVVPNLETILYFTPQETGTYDVVCAEFCGMKHAYMTAKITVVPSSLCEGEV
jgi:cytochrome c oxidase subunit 2